MYDYNVLLSPVPFCMHHRYANKAHGVVTLCDTESDQKWAVTNCVEVFILCRYILVINRNSSTDRMCK